MPWGLGIWVLMRGFRLWLRWVVPGRGHAGGRRVVPGDGRFHGPAGWCPGVVLRCLRWSGGRVREGDDGGGGPGGGPGAAGAGEGAGALGLAGPVPVPVDDGAVFREFPGQRRADGFPGAVAAMMARRARPWEISRAWTRCPARRPFRAGAAAAAAARATPRVISFPAAQAASSCRTRPGLPERSIGPADGPAPSRLAFTSRSAVSDPSHRHL